MINIAIIGSGYVGVVTGTCLSDFGWRVTCVDENEEIISQLNQGISHINTNYRMEPIQKP